MRRGNELTVEVGVEGLLSVLRANREQHQRNVETAKAGFLVTAQAELAEMRQRVLKGDLSKPFFLSLSVPQDYTREYDRAIGMLERHTGTTIEMGSADYARFVDDEWEWKYDWLTSNSAYLGDQ